MNTRQGLIIIIVLLLLLLLGIGFWGFKSNSDKKALAKENTELNEKIGDLTTLRNDLEKQVDSLQQAYAVLAEENETLQGSVADAKKTIAQKEAAIQKITKQNSSETKNLKAQIEELLAVKAQLEASIQNLQDENESLRELTGQLTADLASAKSENAALAALNNTIQDEMKRLTLANFKASAFRVEVERRRPKATAKAGQARRVVVSFDLTDVKKEFRGLRPLYLVITDDKGTPIKADNPIQAKVSVNNQAVDIIAVKRQDIDVVENQRLSFTHELDEKLRSGFYRVAVYTDIGLLGAASFRLQ